MDQFSWKTTEREVRKRAEEFARILNQQNQEGRVDSLKFGILNILFNNNFKMVATKTKKLMKRKGGALLNSGRNAVAFFQIPMASVREVVAKVSDKPHSSPTVQIFQNVLQNKDADYTGLTGKFPNPKDKTEATKPTATGGNFLPGYPDPKIDSLEYNKDKYPFVSRSRTFLIQQEKVSIFRNMKRLN
jgi:hypothetical protein